MGGGDKGQLKHLGNGKTPSRVTGQGPSDIGHTVTGLIKQLSRRAAVVLVHVRFDNKPVPMPRWSWAHALLG